jgi:uncharacterized protein YbjT (DUF2867 family)
MLMHVILGASGQVGSAVVKALLKSEQSVTAVVRNPAKTNELRRNGVPIAQADLFDAAALQEAFRNVDTVFLLTPEDPASQDVLHDAKSIVQNYRDAIQASGVKKLVALSSLGAQHASGTGNLEMSYMLEHAFQGLAVQQIFIRAPYYYSNWMLYLSAAQEQGILPTFFPADLKISMGAPADVAAFIARAITNAIPEQKKLYELTGPAYSSADVASALENILHHKVSAQTIPADQWHNTLLQAGFSENAAANMSKMTQAVIAGITRPEQKESKRIQLPTTLETYFQSVLQEPALNK